MRKDDKAKKRASLFMNMDINVPNNIDKHYASNSTFKNTPWSNDLSLDYVIINNIGVSQFS